MPRPLLPAGLLLSALLALLLLAALSAPAAAQGAQATLVIVADAPVSKQSVRGLGAKLPAPWHLGDDAALRQALAHAGQRKAAGLALGSADGRASLARNARAAATESGTQAVLFVRVTLKPGKHVVGLLLVSPGEADPVVDTTVDVPASDEGAALLDVLGPALARLAPLQGPRADSPAAPENPSAAPSHESHESHDAPRDLPAPGARRTGADSTILELSAGGGSATRIFRYYDGLRGALRSYDLAAAPNLVVAAEVYPFARLDIPVLRGLGLAGGFQHAVALSSQTSSGASVATNWWRAEGELRLRLALGEDGRYLIGLRGGVVKERFGFSGDPTLTPSLPDVDYLFVRAGAYGRLGVGPVAILLDAAYLPAIEGGALADRFRQTSFAAVELGGGLAVPIVRLFEMRATVEYTRVFYAFHPVPGDANVAGGALDNLVRAQIMATLRL